MSLFFMTIEEIKKLSDIDFFKAKGYSQIKLLDNGKYMATSGITTYHNLYRDSNNIIRQA